MPALYVVIQGISLRFETHDGFRDGLLRRCVAHSSHPELMTSSCLGRSRLLCLCLLGDVRRASLWTQATLCRTQFPSPRLNIASYHLSFFPTSLSIRGRSLLYRRRCVRVRCQGEFVLHCAHSWTHVKHVVNTVKVETVLSRFHRCSTLTISSMCQLRRYAKFPQFKLYSKR